MRWMKLILALTSIFMILLVIVYWLIPFEQINFGITSNPSFYVEGGPVEMQFYHNMRFPSNQISYSLEDDCSLKKKNEMSKAFEILENETILEFYPVASGEILISCDEKTKIEDGLFIAGEGGPTNITSGDNFDVILAGKILLIKDSRCSKPNIAIHELFHVLGFNHSENKGNIMYPISSCSQTMGEEIPEKIDYLYSYPSIADLKIGNVSAFMEGRYLNLNVSVSNQGLKESGESKLVVYMNKDSINELELDKIDIGLGLKIKIENLFVTKIKIKELKVVVESEFDELSKDNNYIILKEID